MKIRQFLLFSIFLFLLNDVFAQSFYKRMEGVLGGQGVQLHVTKEDSELTVVYYYQIIGLPVKLTGLVEKDRSFKLENYDDSGNVFETYQGSFSEGFSSIAGMWFNFDSTVNTSFAFEETYTETSNKFDIKTIRYKHYNDSNRLLAEYKNRQLYMVGSENSLAQKSINDTVIKWQYGILPSFAGQKPRKINFEKYGQFFIDSSKTEAAEMEAKQGFFITYGINSSAGVVFNERNISCVELYNYMSVGATHPSEFISYNCFNTLTGKPIKLEELFKGDYKKALTEQANKVLKVRYDIKKKNLKRAGFNMKKLSLNDNFYLTPQGIIFYYNEYEIAPYSYGGIPIFISYESVKKYIKEDGILAWGIYAY